MRTTPNLAQQRMRRWWPIAIPLLANLLLTIFLGSQLIPFVDQDVYLDQAFNIAHGRGLMSSFSQLDGFVRANEPTSFCGVGAQLLYALPMKAFGENYFLLRLVNLLVFAGTLYYFRKLARFWLDENLADWATLAIGVSPFYLAFNQLFMTEMPFLFCQIAFVYYLFAVGREPVLSLRHAAWWGLFFGASLLVRPVLLPMLPIAAILLFRTVKLKSVATFLIACVVVTAPYCARNSIENHGLFLFGGKAAYNLWFFNADVHDRPFFEEDFMRDPAGLDWSGLSEKQRAELAQRTGTTWIKEHPARFLRLALIKGMLFLDPVPKHDTLLWRSVLLSVYASLLLIASAAGLTRIEWRNPEHLFVMVLFLCYLSIDMVFMPASRHRMLFDPFFVLVGALLLQKRGASSPVVEAAQYCQVKS